MFEGIEKTGLNQVELASIYRVSRVTMHNWLKGKTDPHALIVDRARVITKALLAAVRAKALPVEGAKGDKQKMAKVRKVVAQHLAP